MATNLLPANHDEFVGKICTNTRSDYIKITEDKLENILLKFLYRLKKTRGLLAFLSIGITLLISILSSDYKEFVGISGELWKAIFMIAFVICVVTVIIKGFMVIVYWKKLSLKYLVENIKNRPANPNGLNNGNEKNRRGVRKTISKLMWWKSE